MTILSRCEVPVRILRVNTRKIISDSLNAKKVLKTKDNLCRDWRGLAHLCSVTIINQSNPPTDPTDFVLIKWQEQERATVGQFLEFLGRLDRYDVIDDTEEIINKDVERYLHLKDSVGIRAVEEEAVVNHDEQVLTTDDVCRIERGLGPQRYDAFILYADEEWEGAQVLVSQLENEHFKLCQKNDIVVGVSFEHKAIMTLIEERCERLIVLLSPKFVESPSNKFLHLFAQSCQIEKQMRKVIPCIYKSFPTRDDVPSEFRCYKSLMYENLFRWPDVFWHQLRNSVKSPLYIERIKQIEKNGVRIQEMSASNVSNEIRLVLPPNENSVPIAPDRIQNKTCEGIISNTSDEGKINVIQSLETFKNEGCIDNSNESKKNVDLLSEIRVFLRSMTKKIVPGKNKESRRKRRIRCPEVS